MVTPPAVSAKIPSVRASSRMPSTISSSVTAPHGASRTGASRRGHSRRRRGCRWPATWRCARLDRPDGSAPRLEGGGDRRAPCGLGPRDTDVAAPRRAGPTLPQLAETLGHLGQLAARADRHHDVVGRLPAQLLGHLEGQGLGALGVVGAHVDVDEGPRRVLARQLGAQPVDVVVVARRRRPARPPKTAVVATLADLEVVRGCSTTERMPGPGRVGGHGVGQVAGRGAGRHLEPELPGLGQGDRHDPVLERARRVDRVVLDPQVREAQLGRPNGPPATVA